MLQKHMGRASSSVSMEHQGRIPNTEYVRLEVGEGGRRIMSKELMHHQELLHWELVYC